MIDQNKANRVVKFIETFGTHIKGRWAGKPFQLIPWQLNDVIIPAFGTVKPDGKRQYRIVYVEVPKKNGKSELGSIIAIVGLVGDDEYGAEVYSAAGDREQASLVYYPAAQMVRNNPILDKRLQILDSRKRIIDHKSNSYYQVLSAEAFTKHGLNPSMIIFDELHAQPNRELWDVLTTGTDIAREQQMIFVITTAGIFDKTTIGWQIHKYALDVKRGIIEDPSFLPVIHAAGEDDNWEDEEVWKKANKSLDYIFDIENLRLHYTQAKNRPDEINNFKRFRLNIWTSGLIEDFPMAFWEKCGDSINEKQLEGRKCYGGLDLASVSDITSFALVFPPEENENNYIVLSYNFLPNEIINLRTRKDGVPYETWVRSGLVQTTPGNTTDHRFVVKKIEELKGRFNIREIAFDRWGSSLVIEDLKDIGFSDDPDSYEPKILQFGQGFASMSRPSKEILKLTLSNQIRHGNNPVLWWAASNLVFRQDPAGNIKPDKDKSKEKIDPMVALIMALDRATMNQDKTSVLEKEGYTITIA